MKKNKKGFTLVEIMIVVVIIGLLAAMAVPAFQAVRDNARRTAVENNLRQIASAAQQYMLEEGVLTVDYDTIIAADPPLLNPINPIAQEDYSAITVDEDTTQLTIDGADVGLDDDVVYNF